MFALWTIALLGCDGGAKECADGDLITVYADNDNDGYGVDGTEKQVCPPDGAIPRNFSSRAGDCDDFREDVNPGGLEICDGIDNDCDEQADEGLREITFWLDADQDGFGDPEPTRTTLSCAAPPGFVDNLLDCDDQNAGISPDATEVCNEGVDDDCNGLADDLDPFVDLNTATTWYLDADGDSYGTPDEDLLLVQCAQPGGAYVVNALDCDDSEIDVNPAAVEVCNRFDDDCDQRIDDSDPDIDPTTQSTWYADDDEDGFGDPSNSVLACFQPWFYVDNTDDCDDDEPLLGFPAPWLLDNDNDGFGAGALSADSCTPPTPDHVLAVVGVDCDDTNPFVSPLGNEVCDTEDNDCDGLIDDEDPDLDPAFANTWYRDSDNDTYGDPDVTTSACSRPPGYRADDTDCNDAVAAINPAAIEICDNIDNDCDGDIDDDDSYFDPGTAGTWYADFDQDGFGNAAVSVEACRQPDLYTDNPLDCDDTDDTQLVFGPWVYDNDGDGVGAGVESPDMCSAPAPGWVPTYYGLDCDDNDDTRFPGNLEICNNGVDEDCDGIDPPCFAGRTAEPETLDEAGWFSLQEERSLRDRFTPQTELDEPTLRVAIPE